MQIVCIDGTVIEGDQIKQKEKGISIEKKSQQSGGSSKPREVGFVPFERLMYVIPDDVVHNVENLEEIPA